MSQENAEKVIVKVASPEINLKVDLGMVELAKPLLVSVEEALLAERSALETRISDLSKARADLERDMVGKAEQLVAGVKKDESAVVLAKLLSEFTGDEHAIEIAGDPVCNFEKKQVAFTLSIGAPGKSYESKTSERVAAFTPEMQAVAEKIEANRKAQDDESKLLRGVRDELNDVTSGRLERRVVAGLVKAYLAGELTTGKAILAAIESIKVKALPRS